MLKVANVETSEIMAHKVKSLFGIRGLVLLASLFIVVAATAIVGRQTRWQRAFDRHKTQIAAEPWTGARPLYILLGDSHVEGGKWDILCPGPYGLRNCGHGGAKVRHVQEILEAIPDRDVEGVLLMCGINNIGKGDSIDGTFEDFKALLGATRQKLQPKRIVVAAVMPLRQKPETRKFNADIAEFNRRLKKLCLDSNAIFVDVASSVADADGGLSEKLTSDGLHLNERGYRTISPELCGALTQNR